jgi:hypothetical protein
VLNWFILLSSLLTLLSFKPCIIICTSHLSLSPQIKDAIPDRNNIEDQRNARYQARIKQISSSYLSHHLPF